MLSKSDTISSLGRISDEIETVKTSINEVKDNVIKGGKVSQLLDGVVAALEEQKEALNEYATGLEA